MRDERHQRAHTPAAVVGLDRLERAQVGDDRIDVLGLEVQVDVERHDREESVPVLVQAADDRAVDLAVAPVAEVVRRDIRRDQFAGHADALVVHLSALAEHAGLRRAAEQRPVTLRMAVDAAEYGVRQVLAPRDALRRALDFDVSNRYVRRQDHEEVNIQRRDPDDRDADKSAEEL